MLTVTLCEYNKAADGVQGAYQDLVNKCTGALPPGHYGAASFIPAICASGHAVEFCAVGMDGQVAFAAVVGTHVMQMELTAPVFALSLLSYVGIWSATGRFSTQTRPEGIRLILEMANVYQLLALIVR